MINLPVTVDGKGFYQRDNASFEIVNLLEGDYNQAPIDPLQGIDLYLADKDDAMRPDLITQKMYGYLQPIEAVMKFNKVSNPFAIDEGDVFTMWDLPSTEKNFRNLVDTTKQRQDIRNQYVTPEKKSTIDPRYQDFAKRNEAKKPDPSKGDQPALPPNYANFGDKEIQLVSGKLVLGPGVSKGEIENEQPLSKSEFIAKIIKNRINNQ